MKVRICHFIRSTAMRYTRQDNVLSTRASLFFLIIIYILTSLANGSPLMGRVMGGKDAEELAYPYQASLRVKGLHKCGGSLLAHRWILTAAHCLVKYDIKDIIVVLGSTNLQYGGEAYATEDAWVHPLYVAGGRTDDIGLIKVFEYIEYTEAIKPIDLPTKDVDESDCVATFTGWGNTAAEVVNHDELQMIELTVIDSQECKSVFSSVGGGHLCTFTVAGEGVCYGDSGGPLVADGIQIAIASWGSPCARGYPDVHTRVYMYTQWIKSIID